MASNALGPCCIVGVKHRGGPLGKLFRIAGKWDGYLTNPPPDIERREGAGVFCPDAMGVWQNSMLIADRFAASGYLCLVIDFYNGDALALNKPAGFDFAASMGDNPHKSEAIDPIVEAAIVMMNEYGVRKLGSVGYCFGIKYTVRHFKNHLRAAFIAHPTFVAEEELANITGPLSIAAAETDEVFTTSLRHNSEEIVRDTGYPYQMSLFSGVTHGFAVRGSPEVKVENFARE